ncbi:hypothetical protein Tco_1110042 [Tanacetum coccineum]|uniref:Uncharacterized protein n=1 Tax=Tanacetum coccineum TaxID=301880 RepID=A0ABQ5IHX2_9ASTR
MPRHCCRLFLEVLDQTFDRLQKLISQLEIHGESISQEDVNQNTSSTNGAVNTTHGATTASTQATAVNSTTIDNLSDVVICAFFASQPNSPQLDNEDLQQIHPDDLEEMDLSPRWSVTTATKGPLLQGVQASRNKKTEIRRTMNVQVRDNYFHGIELIPADIDKCKIGLGYNVVPPPYTGNFMPPKSDLSYSGLEEFVNEPIISEPIVETSEAKASADKPKVVRKNNGAPIIED